MKLADKYESWQLIDVSYHPVQRIFNTSQIQFSLWKIPSINIKNNCMKTCNYLMTVAVLQGGDDGGQGGQKITLIKNLGLLKNKPLEAANGLLNNMFAQDFCSEDIVNLGPIVIFLHDPDSYFYFVTLCNVVFDK